MQDGVGVLLPCADARGRDVCDGLVPSFFYRKYMSRTSLLLAALGDRDLGGPLYSVRELIEMQRDAFGWDPMTGLQIGVQC